MARNLNGKGKKPMGTAATKAASTANATDIFVNDLMKISRKFLAGVSVEEREVRLKKLNDYLLSLCESDAKQA